MRVSCLQPPPPPELIRRYDVPGPRYTSYPTALQFEPGFGAAAHVAALREAGERRADRPLSAYVHIPFCTSPCFFCGCTKVITRQRAAAEAYRSRLEREIPMQARALGRRRTIAQLHFGGGTPTFLEPAQLARVFAALDRAFGLTAAADREYSIEIDPRSVSNQDLAALAALGINRVSLGVQDFDEPVQRAVNRLQPAADTLARIDAARCAGMRSIAIDLIYGLPLQTPESFGRTLDQVIEAAPDRIATYSYAHLPQRFKPQRRIRSDDLPGADAKLSLLKLSIERLSAAGYVYIGMDHFARPQDELAQALRQGTLQRNFQGYSTRGGLDLIGLGMSAISHLGDSYSQNARTLPDYDGAIDAGRLPVDRGLQMDADDRLRHDIIMQIMCSGRVEFGEIEARYGIAFGDTFAEALRQLAPMQADGLVSIDDHRLRVNPQGRYLLRALAMPFDAYLHAAAGHRPSRYSRVV